MSDATFEDGTERPLRLLAASAEDVDVISSFVQDAVFPVSEISWNPRQRRFALLLNRFRWEDRDAAEKRKRSYERVQSLLIFDDVTGVRTQGVTPGDKDVVLSLLSVSVEATEEAASFVLSLAGDGAFEVQAEAINVTLRDVTRPYRAPSGKVPSHPDN